MRKWIRELQAKIIDVKIDVEIIIIENFVFQIIRTINNISKEFEILILSQNITSNLLKLINS